jgi:hypothetical protein
MTATTLESLLEDMLRQLEYQTKLLETIVESRPADGSKNVEAAMNMVMNMPFIKQLGIDPTIFKNMVSSVKGNCK